jgi:glucans biosynthesis protein
VPVHPGYFPRYPRRRDVLALLGGAASVLRGSTASAQTATPQAVVQGTLGEGQRFEPGLLMNVARVLARRPYVAPASDLPDVFANLPYEQYVAIKALPNATVWAGENRGFTVEPLHRGFVFNTPVTLFTVEDGLVRRIAYDRSRFEFGRLNVPATVGDVGFSGFRLNSTYGNGQVSEFAIIQGATFFRALARGQNFGVVARALTLRPAETRGEEVPLFRAFWIERPTPGVNQIVLHGLIDSESATGVVRMTLRPGEITISDVEMTLVPRVNLDHVGFGGMAATYLFGPNDRRGVDDARPAVYEATGLQIHNGQDEWLWRPLNNPDTLQISAFLDKDPRGFGLLQRDRDYGAFHDDEQRFERRPSLWTVPLGDWGEGAVQLIEIPSESEVNDNILAYWRPRAPIAAGTEFALAYRQFWCWAVPERPPLALVAGTRVGRGNGGRRRRFFVDFTGEGLNGGLPADLKPLLNVAPGSAQNLKLFPYPDRKTVRVAFDLDPGTENASELRLALEGGGKIISETWLYRWTP